MPRKNLIRTKDFYYHITTRANHKEWFRLPLEDVWQISCMAFIKAYKNHPAEISQFVLMGNHYHMLIRTPNEDIDKFMFFFNKTFSDEIRNTTQLENRMFGSNYKWSLITDDTYFKNVFRYIYQNPLRAHIVNLCEEYPYSTLYYSNKRINLPFRYSPILEFEQNLEFLNHAISQEERVGIQKGLKKTNFRPVTNKNY